MRAGAAADGFYSVITIIFVRALTAFSLKPAHIPISFRPGRADGNHTSVGRPGNVRNILQNKLPTFIFIEFWYFFKEDLEIQTENTLNQIFHLLLFNFYFWNIIL